ncbi:MAG: hypothetical protein BA867_13200 [Desulfobacterales bacterium S5133MH16]|nr:MAG: hypothetical protein BA867_13200 [Desulfobacterales bacterium S5133MH16]
MKGYSFLDRKIMDQLWNQFHTAAHGNGVFSHIFQDVFSQTTAFNELFGIWLGHFENAGVTSQYLVP